tara:strand:- start:1174 stop:1404 length:231 start_codon:yes stop_codon:yes gene_type:complete
LRPTTKLVNAALYDTRFAHLAFDVTGIDAAIGDPQVYGFRPINSSTTIDQGPNTGSRVVYLRDADGVTIEFIEKNL